MTWADQLEEQEAKLIEIKKEWEEAVKANNHTLEMIDEELLKLEITRASIGERRYSADKKTLLKLQEENLEYKRQFIAQKELFKTGREVLDKAWLKTEEMRYKGLRG